MPEREGHKRDDVAEREVSQSEPERPESDAQSVGNDQGKYMGHGESELGRKRTGDPDRMAEPDAVTRSADPESGSEFVEQQRPHFATSMDQREIDSDLPEETQGMALKEDAAPGADAQGG